MLYQILRQCFRVFIGGNVCLELILTVSGSPILFFENLSGSQKQIIRMFLGIMFKNLSQVSHAFIIIDEVLIVSDHAASQDLSLSFFLFSD